MGSAHLRAAISPRSVKPTTSAGVLLTVRMAEGRLYSSTSSGRRKAVVVVTVIALISSNLRSKCKIWRAPLFLSTHVGMDLLYTISIWLLPLLIAITFHEAAHGYVARFFGDETAARLGRVSLNPLRHIDPFGTVLLPGLLLLTRSPFLFGYAKPVPVNFRALRNPRIGMVLVAAAGPAMNIALAIVAALGFHLVGYLPAPANLWAALNLENALIINAVLAVFNLFPLPPLDGGRIAVGLLPNVLGQYLARLEPYGMIILIGLLILLPLLGSQLGLDLGFLSRIISISTDAVIGVIVRITGNL